MGCLGTQYLNGVCNAALKNVPNSADEYVARTAPMTLPAGESGFTLQGLFGEYMKQNQNRYLFLTLLYR